MLGKRSDQKGLWEADRLYLDYVGKDTFYGLLASLRGQLFSDDDFAEIFWVLPVSGWISLSKTIIPDAQEHFLTSSARRHSHLFGGLGVKGVVGQGKCPGKCSAEMPLRYAAMVSDVDGLGAIRCFHPGGPPASR